MFKYFGLLLIVFPLYMSAMDRETETEVAYPSPISISKMSDITRYDFQDESYTIIGEYNNNTHLYKSSIKPARNDTKEYINNNTAAFIFKTLELLAHPATTITDTHTITLVSSPQLTEQIIFDNDRIQYWLYEGPQAQAKVSRITPENENKPLLLQVFSHIIPAMQSYT